MQSSLARPRSRYANASATFATHDCAITRRRRHLRGRYPDIHEFEASLLYVSMRLLPNRSPRFLTMSNVPKCRTAFMIDWPSNFIGAPHEPVDDDTEAGSHIDATRHPNGPSVPP